MVVVAAASDGLSHHALFYRDQREYLACIAAFAYSGLASAEPVFIAIPGHKSRLVSEQLGEDSRHMCYADMAETGLNPARIIPAVRSFMDHHPRQRVRFVEEPAWPGRSAAERCEVARHEALINLAFAGTAASILCLYAADGLGDSVTGTARRTHPEIFSGGLLLASAFGRCGGWWRPRPGAAGYRMTAPPAWCWRPASWPPIRCAIRGPAERCTSGRPGARSSARWRTRAGSPIRWPGARAGPRPSQDMASGWSTRCATWWN
jgi:hypothetical protein